MNTHAATTSESTLSITESGLTTLRLAVQADATDGESVVVETRLPAAVDPSTVAVEESIGDWTVYADGTVHWATTATGDDAMAARLGVPVADPVVVDSLAAADPSVLAPADASQPTHDDDPVPTVDVADLADASASDRVPEEVYERVREHAPTEPTDESSDDATDEVTEEPMDDATTRESTITRESTSTANDDAESSATVVAAAATDDRGTVEETPVVDHEWAGDALENALRVQDESLRADETAYRFRLSFDATDATRLATDVLEGLLNGTTVYGANPTLPDLEAGANPDELAVTISSALDENALVGALDAIDAVDLECFERVDFDALPAESLDANADEQFAALDDEVAASSWEAFADEVAAVEADGFDFGDEPGSFDDLVANPDRACERAAAADADEPATAATDDEASGEPDSTDRGESSRVAERLLDELERGGVTERERVELRRRLGVDPRTSTEARIDHLQSRVEELSAYAGALESFLDENGTARELLEDLQADVGALHDRTDDAESERNALYADVADLETTVDDVEDAYEAVDDRLAGVDDEISDVTTRLDDVTEARQIDTERLDDLADAVESNSDDIDHLASDVRGDVDELSTAVADLEETMTAIDDRLESLAETVEENSRVREKLEALAS